jgi:uncharacterized surface protein with fasciclin (FAS1) repeats
MSSQDQSTINLGTGRNESLVPKRILQTVEGLPSISRFLEGVRATRLGNELNNPGWRTLFAPTNEALEAAPNDFWNELMKPESAERLRAIVALHIVRGRQMLVDLKTTATVKSLGGEPVEVSLEGPEGYFGGARIVRADIACLNGQLHLIDKLVVREYSYAG